MIKITYSIMNSSNISHHNKSNKILIPNMDCPFRFPKNIDPRRDREPAVGCTRFEMWKDGKCVGDYFGMFLSELDRHPTCEYYQVIGRKRIPIHNRLFECFPYSDCVKFMMRISKRLPKLILEHPTWWPYYNTVGTKEEIPKEEIPEDLIEFLAEKKKEAESQHISDFFESWVKVGAFIDMVNEERVPTNFEEIVMLGFYHVYKFGKNQKINCFDISRISGIYLPKVYIAYIAAVMFEGRVLFNHPEYKVQIASDSESVSESVSG